MKAVVMAGGEGSRLRPLTIGRPKPMVPIVGKPVMEHIVDLLRKHGITDIVVTLQYLPGVIQDYFGDGSGFGVNLSYSVEDQPLGTAGSVKYAMDYLDETFLVISGDAITDFDLTQILDFHRRKQAAVTMTLYRVPNPLEYGVIITDEVGRIQQFLEKPSWGEVFSDTVNTGIYVLEPSAMEQVPDGESYDFSQQLFPKLLEQREALYGYVAPGYWCDVGSLPEYMRATADILQGRTGVPVPGEEVLPRVWVQPGANFSREAEIVGPVFLGQDSRIRSGAKVIGPAAIGDYAIIDGHAQVERSIVWSNSYLGEGVQLSGAIVGKQCNIRRRAVILEGAVVGDNTIIGEDAIVQSGVRIWPNKELETGASLNESLIWGGRAHRSLFGAYGISGLVNVDVTPEFASRVGAAYGAVLSKGSNVTVNRDPHRSPRMIKRALISGLPSSGANVLDIQTVPIPVARYVTRHSNAAGGIHVRISPFDDRIVEIKFFDAQGMDLDKNAERRIENAFFREDFRRVYLDDIGNIVVDENVADSYVRDFLQAVDLEAIRRASFNVVIDYAHGSSTLVFPKILRQLGCEMVAINSSIDEMRMFRTAEQFDQEMQQLAAITKTLNFDFGVRIDLGGEKVFLVDNTGRLLDRMVAFAAMTSLFFCRRPGASIAAPIGVPMLFEGLAASNGGQIVQTRAATQALMLAASRQHVGLAGDGDGGFVFPSFLPAFDAMLATAKLMELLAECNTKLSDVVDSLPPYYMATSHVGCPWDHKGKVMRELSEQYRTPEDTQIDGIKIGLDDAWVLIQPDADRPMFHVTAEGGSHGRAEQLAGEYSDVVKSLAK
ncbi:MAG TPA: mannose-1-phosphate guanyltransferase [Chloroflexota bacterium]|nr:mannose-1-phosphate guanyltransferase [Chloroflexota bacterium]